ncbi:dihydrolipoamide acetyltransferase family protein [Streptomyces sulphureus]|uniref:dihydrolipoamide acetyltransferase family protein n=1 Tax=Streptomyces sulphureus TaxID=47758 RepID=UPI00037D2263|nr:dihydrolipoamide acetyltransferase family protein [Streptomyces sulphureus]
MTAEQDTRRTGPDLAASEFALPDLGEGLTEATVVRWLVDEGERIDVDAPVVEVETAKATVEVPCPYAGTVLARHAAEGAELPVGAPLVTIGSAERPAEAEPAEDGASGNVLVGYGTRPAERRRRRVRPGAPDGGPRTPPPAHAPEPSGAPRTARVISPLVRRLAREHGVDLRGIDGSGPEGLILRADVERAANPPARQGSPGTRLPLTGVRGATAAKLARSRREIPDATCWVDADATRLLETRRALNESAEEERISLAALLGRIATAALARHPELNSTVDTEANEVVLLPEVHLGFAAQTPRGLVVPVVRDAHERTTGQLAAELRRLTEAAQEGRLAPADLTGGTFTVNNYGVFGVDGSTPIVNHPETAMLGVGRVVEKPWAFEGQLALRRVVQLSLTFDHRVCDGGTAGGFLRYVADCVEEPARLLRAV